MKKLFFHIIFLSLWGLGMAGAVTWGTYIAARKSIGKADKIKYRQIFTMYLNINMLYWQKKMTILESMSDLFSFVLKWANYFRVFIVENKYAFEKWMTPSLTFAADFPMGIRVWTVFKLFAVSPLAFSCECCWHSKQFLTATAHTIMYFKKKIGNEKNYI